MLTKILSKLIHYLNWNFHYLEALTSFKNTAKLNYPVIFIIGSPRSGSTLLYQVLSDYYDIGYLSNIHCRFFGFPSLLELFIRPSKYHEFSDYCSHHGRTKNWNNPCECGNFWYRFFPLKPQYISLEDIDEKKIIYLRKTICSLANTFAKPILFKNLICTLRLQAIAKALPEAVFIVLHRNLIDNSHSLLEGRKKTYGSYNTWWSAEPPEINELMKLPPEQQVVEQIRHIYNLIEKDKQTIAPDRFVNIDYEKFCDDTHQVINKLDNFFSFHGFTIPQRTALSNIPQKFPRRNFINIDQKLYQRLVEYAKSQINTKYFYG